MALFVRPLDIGIASYQNPAKLDKTIRQIRETCRSDWRLFIFDNASPDLEVRSVIQRHASEEARIVPVLNEVNGGYSGAVNQLLTVARIGRPPFSPRGPYAAYVDNDCYVYTPGWDLMMMELLDQVPEVGMVFPGGGPWPFDHPKYREILWGVGFCWMLRLDVIPKIALRDRGYPMMIEADYGLFDTQIGHQDEVDFQTRLRLAGYHPACMSWIQAEHEASSTNSEAAQARINAGVVRWVNKWNELFYGVGQTYHSHNVMRIQDWPPFQLYLERIYQAALPGLNEAPAEVTIEGSEMDLVRVPKPKNYYRDRIV